MSTPGKSLAPVLALCLLLAAVSARAARWVEPSGGTEKCRTPRYMTVKPTEVVPAADALGDGESVCVRFTDGFAGMSAEADSRPAFRTTCGLTCTMEEGVRRGLSDPGPGAPVTVEGELNAGGQQVLVHRVMPGRNRRSSIERELVLRPADSVPRLVEKPGTFSFGGDESGEPALEVQVELKRARLLRRRASQENGSGQDSFETCRAPAAYQWAKHGMRRTVTFEGQVSELRRAPGAWRTFKVADNQTRRCTLAVVMNCGLWCLLPSGDDVAAGLRGPLFAGRRVRVSGSTLGLRDPGPALAVERLRPPKGATVPDRAWKVTVSRGNDTRVFYRPGRYELTFPEDRVIRATLREKRKVPRSE